MRKIFIILSVVILSNKTLLLAEETPWNVPADKAENTAPFIFNDNNIKQGEQIYLKNCKSCHGDIGQANMVPLNPLPKDMATAQVQKQTDGALYYKINEGRGTMPKFKSALLVNDKWNVIAYLRSFNNKYKQPKPSTLKAYAGGAIILTMKWDAQTHKMQVLAVGKKDGKETPAEGVEIALYVKRYFGNLKLGESSFTNKVGSANFSLNNKLPGDSIGTLQLIAKLVDVDSYGEIDAQGEFVAGTPTYKPGLTEKRAMWNVVSKAPWWVTIAYPAVVLAVLATIMYIALLVRKIHQLGKNNNS